MSEYIVKCPICRKQYKMTPKDPSTLAQKTFSCPNCHYTTPFTSLIKGVAAPQSQTQSEGTDSINRSQKMHSPTKVSQNVGMQSKAYILVLGSNAKFVLNQGVYILGRKSSDSTATIQLAPDINMSRQHARLAVQMVGGKLMAQIICLKANNPILINDKLYAAGQPCTLKNGDKIQLGSTYIIISI